MMTAGELCAGYNGLGRAVEEVFNARPAWFFEYESGPSKILAHHYPDVPNHGDMTRIDWAAVEPVDILSGGTPCQDLSHAGRRGGMTEGTRSNLWVQMREAVAIIKPKYVVWENVRGAYSASAFSELESREGRVGSAGSGGPVLRALGRVLGDLSNLGYDAQWHGLRAADVGAPHGRFRVFVLATRPGVLDTGHSTGSTQQGNQLNPDDGLGESGHRTVSDTGSFRRHEAVKRDGRGTQGIDGASIPNESDREPLRTGSYGEDAPDPSGDGWDQGRAESAGLQRGSDAPLSGDATQDTLRGGSRRRATIPGDGISAGADTTPIGSDDRSSESGTTGTTGQATPYAIGGERADWGPYEPAIRRWETVLGRRAPNPTEPTGRNGNHRLSARFTEFLMGQPDGWITDPAIGLTRNEQLKACGNGVVTLQAVAALRYMLAAEEILGVA